MIRPELPPFESERLAIVRKHNLQSIRDKEDLQFLVNLSASICETGIALLTIVEEHKQIIIASTGTSLKETDRSTSFCGHAILNPEMPLVIEDTLKDSRFFDNPLVTGDPNIRFYAGVPIQSTEGFALGTLCVLDSTVKHLPAQKLKVLQDLAKQVGKLYELRRANFELDLQAADLRSKVTLLSIAQHTNKLGTWEYDIETKKVIWSSEVYKIHGLDADSIEGVDKAIEFYHKEDRSIVEKSLQLAITEGTPFTIVCRLCANDNKLKWVKSSGTKIATKIVGSFQDITEFKNNELKYKGIFDSTYSILAILNTDGKVSEINNSSLKLANITEESVIGKFLWNTPWWFENQIESEKLKANVLKCSGNTIISFETSLYITKTQHLRILLSLRPIADEAGNLRYIIAEGHSIEEIVGVRNRLQNVIDCTNVGTWEWNVATGSTIFNDQWAEMLGYRLAELFPTSLDTFTKLCHPEDFQIVREQLELCFSKKQDYYEVEIRMLQKSGDWLWVLTRGKVYDWSNDGKPLVMYGTHHNINSKKQKELEFANQKKILDALYELSPIGIALNNFDTGEFIDVNEKLLEPTGYSKEEFLKLDYWQITPREYAQQENRALEDLAGTNRYGPYQKEYLRKDGSRYPVSLKGTLVTDMRGQRYIWSFVQDISAEVKAKNQLEQAISRLEGILNSSTQVSIIATNLQGTITIFNSGAEKMLGYTAEEMIGFNSPEIIHLKQEIEEEAQTILRQDGIVANGFDAFIHYAKKGQPKTKEWTYKRKDGSTFPVLLSVTAKLKGGEITGYLGVATDISDVKLAENEIRSLLEITKKQNQTLRNFAHIVSHNLRSHSSGLSGLYDILINDKPQLATDEIVAHLGKGVTNLSKTIKELTQVVSVNLTVSNKEIISLYDVVKRNIESLSIRTQEIGFKIYNHIDELAKVNCVPAYLDSIVLNMITNAIKYRKLDGETVLNISCEFQKSMVAISFADNGLGIDLEKHGEKIFGMYRTFHGNPDARGVGLFMSKNQVESMNGKLEIESKVNVGTTFKLLLPYV